MDQKDLGLEDCPVCGGVGKQFTETMARYGDEGVKCDHCNGTGKKEKEED